VHLPPSRHPERGHDPDSTRPLGIQFGARERRPADHTVVARLQQAANLANENCDRATALAHTLSAQLRDAQFRINQLELDADRLVEPLRAEVETAIAKLQSDASARVELTRREADARIARVEADAETRILQLQGEFAIARDRIARVETEANERLSRAWAEIEDRIIRLKADLAQAELRADCAEQWLELNQQGSSPGSAGEAAKV
jgi:chemotaxis protein histidine kinase CheA